MLKAYADERVMLTNDVDFLALVAQRAAQRQRVAPIFFWPQQRRSIGQLVRSIIREANSHDYEAACSRVFFL